MGRRKKKRDIIDRILDGEDESFLYDLLEDYEISIINQISEKLMSAKNCNFIKELNVERDEPLLTYNIKYFICYNHIPHSFYSYVSSIAARVDIDNYNYAFIIRTKNMLVKISVEDYITVKNLNYCTIVIETVASDDTF